MCTYSHRTLLRVLDLYRSLAPFAKEIAQTFLSVYATVRYRSQTTVDDHLDSLIGTIVITRDRRSARRRRSQGESRSRDTRNTRRSSIHSINSDSTGTEISSIGITSSAAKRAFIEPHDFDQARKMIAAQEKDSKNGEKWS